MVSRNIQYNQLYYLHHIINQNNNTLKKDKTLYIGIKLSSVFTMLLFTLDSMTLSSYWIIYNSIPSKSLLNHITSTCVRTWNWFWTLGKISFLIVYLLRYLYVFNKLIDLNTTNCNIDNNTKRIRNKHNIILYNIYHKCERKCGDCSGNNMSVVLLAILILFEFIAKAAWEIPAIAHDRLLFFVNIILQDASDLIFTIVITYIFSHKLLILIKQSVILDAKSNEIFSKQRLTPLLNAVNNKHNHIESVKSKSIDSPSIGSIDLTTASSNGSDSNDINKNNMDNNDNQNNYNFAKSKLKEKQNHI